MKTRKFYDIMTAETPLGDEATILLYGFIGEEYTLQDGEWQDTGIKDLDFVSEFNRLQAKCKRINLRINSYGGSVKDGAAIVTAIQNAQCEVHTYVDGMALSMAAAIFLAAPYRHMSPGSMLMLHNGSSIAYGNAKDMRDTADALDKVDKALCEGISASIGRPAEEIMQLYFNYKDNWLTASEAKEAGFVTEEEQMLPAQLPYELPEEEELKAMNYNDVVKHIRAKASAQRPVNFLQKIRAAWTNGMKAVDNFSTPVKTTDMTFNEFKASLGKELDIEQVKAALAEVQASAPAPASVTASAEESVAAVKAELEALKAQITALASQPGAAKSEPSMPTADPTPVNAEATRYQAMHEEFLKAADSYAKIRVTK
jgi:ATP-dependent Clp protease protease subunit